MMEHNKIYRTARKQKKKMIHVKYKRKTKLLHVCAKHKILKEGAREERVNDKKNHERWIHQTIYSQRLGKSRTCNSKKKEIEINRKRR
jgi:hypothetical protein